MQIAYKLVSFFLEKMETHYVNHVSFRIFHIFFKNISFIAIFIIVFYEVLLNLEVYLFHLKPFTGHF